VNVGSLTNRPASRRRSIPRPTCARSGTPSARPCRWWPTTASRSSPPRGGTTAA